MTTSQQQQTGWQTADDDVAAAPSPAITVEIPPPWADELLRLIAESQTLPAPVPLESVVERRITTGVLGFIVAGFEDGDDAPRFLSQRFEPYESLTAAREAADAEQRMEDRMTASSPFPPPRRRVTFRPLAVIEVTS